MPASESENATLSLSPPTEDYVLYADKKKMLSGLNKRMIIICLPALFLVVFISAIFNHGIPVPTYHRHHFGPPYTLIHASAHTTALFGWFPWFFAVEIVVLWLITGAAHRKQAKPIVILRPQGITIDTMATHVGEMTWDEVETVRCYNFVYRYVGIVPRDTFALCRRLGVRRGWVIWMSAVCIPLYKALGMFVAPINIPQVYLPIAADELEAKIHSYQAAYGHSSAVGQGNSLSEPTEGTWPPPPVRS